MAYSVTQTTVSEHPTAVVVAATTWDAYPSLWPQLLDEVWAVARSTDAIVPGRNVMLYKDDVPNVEVGVLVDEPITPAGRVVNSHLPEGPTASITHKGPYERMGEAYDAIKAQGHAFAGPHWEIYGHAADVPEVEIVYLLAT
jgi:effector-binding domain-containing protein